MNVFKTCTLKTILSGFTLAELLIALAILGIIAAFTIPKVLQNNQDGQRKTIMKETVGYLSDAVFAACNQDNTQSQSDLTEAVHRRMNPVRECANAADCGVDDSLATGLTQPHWLQLHNGAVLYIGAGDAADFNLDWNGVKGPNAWGEDRMSVLANSLASTFYLAQIGRCKVVAHPDPLVVPVANQSLFQSLFN